MEYARRTEGCSKMNVAVARLPGALKQVNASAVAAVHIDGVNHVVLCVGAVVVA